MAKALISLLASLTLLQFNIDPFFGCVAVVFICITYAITKRWELKAAADALRYVAPTARKKSEDKET